MKRSINFTADVRHVLSAARDLAHDLGFSYVGTEHLLLAISEVTSLLLPFITREDLREQIVREVGKKPKTGRTGELPYTSGAKRMLELAMREAQGSADSVDVKHLLLALVVTRGSSSSRVLERLGIASRGDWEARFGDARSAESLIQIDDDSELSYYEQIVARIKELVATGKLAPAQRLPSVRRLADLLDIAPGTVARAYAELERTDVVETDGARGTRVAARRPSSSPPDRRNALVDLLRPVAVAAFHMGAKADELRNALEQAMGGVLAEE